ncbi:unnamed protein product, partial [Cladocopium goreaui]
PLPERALLARGTTPSGDIWCVLWEETAATKSDRQKKLVFAPHWSCAFDQTCAPTHQENPWETSLQGSAQQTYQATAYRDAWPTTRRFDWEQWEEWEADDNSWKSQQSEGKGAGSLSTSPFAPLAPEMPAWTSTEASTGSNTPFATSTFNPNTAEQLAQKKECVAALRAAYPDGNAIPSETKDLIDKMDKDIEKIEKDNNKFAQKALTETLEAKKAHRTRWIKHITEAVTTWQEQLKEYQKQQASLQEVITKAKEDIELARSAIQTLSSTASQAMLASMPPITPVTAEQEDGATDADKEEETLQGQLQTVLQDCAAVLSRECTTPTLDGEDMAMDDAERDKKELLLREEPALLLSYEEMTEMHERHMLRKMNQTYPRLALQTAVNLVIFIAVCISIDLDINKVMEGTVPRAPPVQQIEHGAYLRIIVPPPLDNTWDIAHALRIFHEAYDLFEPTAAGRIAVVTIQPETDFSAEVLESEDDYSNLLQYKSKVSEFCLEPKFPTIVQPDTCKGTDLQEDIDVPMTSSHPTTRLSRRPRPLHDGTEQWFWDLGQFFSAEAVQEVFDGDSYLYLQTWYVDHRHYIHCRQPRPLRLDQCAVAWLEEFRYLWRDLLDPTTPFSVFVIRPRPPQGRYQDYSCHVLIEQNRPQGKSAGVLTTVLPGSRENDIVQGAYSVPRFVRIDDLIETMSLQPYCDGNRCTAFYHFEPIHLVQATELATGFSIKIQVTQTQLQLPISPQSQPSDFDESFLMQRPDSNAPQEVGEVSPRPATEPACPTFQFDPNAAVFTPELPDLASMNEFIQDLHALWSRASFSWEREPPTAEFISWFVDHREMYPTDDAPGSITFLGWQAQQIMYEHQNRAFTGTDQIGAEFAEREALIFAGLWRLALNSTIPTIFRTDSSTTADQSMGRAGFAATHPTIALLRGIFQALTAGMRYSELEVSHVKGHAGDVWNELADFLAKSEAANGHRLHRQSINLLELQSIMPYLWMFLDSNSGLPSLTRHGFDVSPPNLPAADKSETVQQDPQGLSQCQDVNLSVASLNVGSLFLSPDGFSGKLTYLRQQMNAHAIHIMGIQEARSPPGVSTADDSTTFSGFRVGLTIATWVLPGDSFADVVFGLLWAKLLRKLEDSTQGVLAVSLRNFIRTYPISWTKCRKTLAAFCQQFTEEDAAVLNWSFPVVVHCMTQMQQEKYWDFLHNDQAAVILHKPATICEWEKWCADLADQPPPEWTQWTPQPQSLTRQKILLHAFAGRRRRGDIEWYLDLLSQQLEGCVILTVSIDIVIDSVHGDIAKEETRVMWLHHIRQGHVAGFIAGPPCNTWSRVRAVQLAGNKGPRVIRTPDAPWGLNELRLGELHQVTIGTILLGFAFECMLAMAMYSGSGLLEHPKDSEDESTVSIWRLP